MMTVGKIQRLWNSKQYNQLVDELSAQRVEALAARELVDRPTVAAAAWGLIRLEELNQPQAPLCRVLITAILSRQEADGGWGDVAVTALALRALCLWEGHGPAIDRGMNYLAQLQQPAGIWPKIPIRRMSADALVSAFVMLELAGNAQFRATVDFVAAVNWFEMHASDNDSIAQTLWTHARPRGVIHNEPMLFQPAN
jgi:hypothetical protein